MGSGMSAGVEGPIVQIGGAVGSTVSRYMRSSAARLKVLIACGAGAAISATYGAPITGVLFAQEIILLGQFQLRSFMLIVLSSATAEVFNHWVKANEASALVVKDYPWHYNHELALYAVMGVLLGVLAYGYIRTVYGARDRFDAWAIPEWMKPIIGGLMVGLIAIILPWVTGNGYPTLNMLFRSEHWGGWLLVAIALGKMLATGITLGAGGSGGVFAPALVIGGTFGGGFAEIVNEIHHGTIAHPGTFVLVGMGALLGAATHAPLTSIFLLLEVTHDYKVMLPIMFATVAAVLVARSLEPESIDTLDLARRGIHIHDGHEANVLKALHVGAFYSREYQPVPLSMPLGDFLHYLPGSRFTYFPVVDDNDELAGVITTQDVRDILFERDVWPLSGRRRRGHHRAAGHRDPPRHPPRGPAPLRPPGPRAPHRGRGGRPQEGPRPPRPTRHPRGLPEGHHGPGDRRGGRRGLGLGPWRGGSSRPPSGSPSPTTSRASGPGRWRSWSTWGSCCCSG